MKNKFLFIVAIAFIQTISNLSNDIYFPIVSGLGEILKISDNLMQSTVSAWFMGAVITQMCLGPIASSLNRKYIIIAATILFALGSLLCLLSNYFSLFMGRFLLGLSASGIFISCGALIPELYKDPKECVKILGYINAVTSTSSCFGPIFSSYTFTYLNWQILFWVLSALTLLSLPFTIFFIHDKKNTFLMNNIDYNNIIKNYKDIIKNPTIITMLLIINLVFLTWGTIGTSISFIFVELLKFNTKNMGFITMSLMLIYIGTTAITAHIAKFIRVKNLFLFSLTLIAIDFLTYNILNYILGVNFYITIICFAIFHFCIGLIIVHINNVLLFTGAKDKGSKVSLMVLAMMAGNMTGSLLVSIFYNKTILSISLIMLAGASLNLGIYIYALYFAKQKIQLS